MKKIDTTHQKFFNQFSFLLDYRSMRHPSNSQWYAFSTKTKYKRNICRLVLRQYFNDSNATGLIHTFTDNMTMSLKNWGLIVVVLIL